MISDGDVQKEPNLERTKLSGGAHVTAVRYKSLAALDTLSAWSSLDQTPPLQIVSHQIKLAQIKSEIYVSWKLFIPFYKNIPSYAALKHPTSQLALLGKAAKLSFEAVLSTWCDFPILIVA